MFSQETASREALTQDSRDDHDVQRSMQNHTSSLLQLQSDLFRQTQFYLEDLIQNRGRQNIEELELCHKEMQSRCVI